MQNAEFRSRSPLGAAQLWVLLAVALALRLALMPLPEPFEADLGTFWRPWMAHSAQHGLADLYLHGEPAVNYPPLYLALLMGLGKLYRLAAPDMAETWLQRSLIKLPAALADLGVAALLAFAARRAQRAARVDDRGARESRETREGGEAGKGRDEEARLLVSPPVRLPLLAAGLWALNPAVIYVSAYWGQVDSIHTLWMVAALLAGLAGSWAWAGVLLALGVLTKLQAVVLLPLLMVLAWRAGWARLARLGLGLGASLALGLLPFALSGSLAALLRVYSGSVGFYHYLTVGALNLWWPIQYLGNRLTGERLSDSLRLLGPITPRWVGLGLMAAYALAVLWPWLRAPRLATRSDLRPSTSGRGAAGPAITLAFFAAGLLVFGFFMLPTEMHERYILPALAFLALPAARDRKLLLAYLALSVAVLLNLVGVLPFAAWIYRLLSALPGERLAVALANLALLIWMTYRYLQDWKTHGLATLPHRLQ